MLILDLKKRLELVIFSDIWKVFLYLNSLRKLTKQCLSLFKVVFEEYLKKVLNLYSFKIVNYYI